MGGIKQCVHLHFFHGGICAPRSGPGSLFITRTGEVLVHKSEWLTPLAGGLVKTQLLGSADKKTRKVGLFYKEIGKKDLHRGVP